MTTTFLSALFLLGVLIFVHELGHFAVAKLLGVKVLKFSLGFGPRLFGWKRGETEYILSAVPLGGYVKMLGEDKDDEVSDEDRLRTFGAKPIWKRLAIVLSGPFSNILFAAFVFSLVFLSGVPVQGPEIGEIAQGSSAAQAGLRTGDRITEIDARPVQDWEDIETVLGDAQGRDLSITVNRNGAPLGFRVAQQKKMQKNLFGEEREVWEIGISPLIRPIVGNVTKGSPADKAGLRRGDRIAEVGGIAPVIWQDLTMVISSHPEEPLSFTIVRNGERLPLTITPRAEAAKGGAGEAKKVGRIGIAPLESSLTKKFGPLAALSLGMKRTWDTSVFTIVAIAKLIQRVIPADTIGGPIMIVQMAGEQASHGSLSFFVFMAVISINLGVANLLPIPILDGGHVLFLSLEALRRKPLSERFMMMAQRVGLALLITLMVFAFYNDIARLITGRIAP